MNKYTYRIKTGWRKIGKNRIILEWVWNPKWQVFGGSLTTYQYSYFSIGYIYITRILRIPNE